MSSGSPPRRLSPYLVGALQVGISLVALTATRDKADGTHSNPCDRQNAGPPDAEHAISSPGARESLTLTFSRNRVE